jgi:hypothetical protein
MVFQDHRMVPVSVFMIIIAASEHLKRVTGRIFRISRYRNFKEASKKFNIKYHNSKLFKNFENQQRM